MNISIDAIYAAIAALFPNGSDIKVATPMIDVMSLACRDVCQKEPADMLLVDIDMALMNTYEVPEEARLHMMHFVCIMVNVVLERGVTWTPALGLHIPE